MYGRKWSDDYLLFLVLDGNENFGDYNGKYGFGRRSFNYENEAIKCVKSWRENGGWLKDIDIVCFRPSDREICQETLTILRSYDVKCDFTYTIDRENYPCGYWNVPFAGRLLEDMNLTRYIIHIDLDMFLMRELPLDFIFPKEDVFAKIAINEHRPTDQPEVNIEPIYPFEINTGFIVSRTDKYFYSIWWEHLKNKSMTLDPNDPNYSIWEERICDEMYFDMGYRFDFFDKYQLNSDVSDYSDKDMKGLYFLHGHPELKKRNENYLKKYIKKLLTKRGKSYEKLL
jgi:hypothetical protein